jgi:hypothetical protein
MRPAVPPDPEPGAVVSEHPEAPDPGAALWQPAQAGAVRYRVHHLAPRRRAWRLVAGVMAVFAPVAVLFGFSGGPWGIGVLEAAWTLLILPQALIIFGLTRIRVCERALVLDRMFAGTAYVIPYATIDPASVMIDWKPKWGSAFRYRIGTGHKDYPWAAMAHYVIASQTVLTRTSWKSPQPLNVRRAPWSRCLVSARGLHPLLASVHYRAKNHGGRMRLMFQAWIETRQLAELRPVTTFGGVPVMRWLLGSDHPEKLLAEIEHAMVAAGFSGASGLTARALATSYDQPPKTVPADPALW